PQKAQDILFITKRVYQLYFACGPSHLYFTHLITPYILQRLWKEDFLTLKMKTQVAAQQELNKAHVMDELLNSR
ncbi:7085_t:CDS:2, partial [Racocetra fulgida]